MNYLIFTTIIWNTYHFINEETKDVRDLLICPHKREPSVQPGFEPRSSASKPISWKKYNSSLRLFERHREK
jgi:hypothetical protein